MVKQVKIKYLAKGKFERIIILRVKISKMKSEKKLDFKVPCYTV